MIKGLLATVVSFLLVLSISAQGTHTFTEVYCKHEDHALKSQMVDGDQGALQQMQADEMLLEQFTQQFIANGGESKRGSGFVIPVVFHIIHNGGAENISDAQVRDAIRVLNRDMNLMNTDTAQVVSQFKSLIADVGIEFRLATKDPNGNCTKGITRTQSPLTTQGDQDMKDLIIWPRNMYMNVWVCFDAAGAAGYTNYPSSVSGPWGLDTDGIVLRYDYTGSIGTSSDFRSRTLTHEVGHWLNLRHVWGNSNSPGQTTNCSEDDNVTDTPNTMGWTSCNVNGNTCGSDDNVQNYMEYSYCSRMFTIGQKARMLAALNSNTASRNSLHQTSNLLATGVDNAALTALCEAEFSSDYSTVCSGDSILFTDVSFNGVSSRNWTFQGGVPATSNDSSVWVRFDTPGTYDVSLVATDGSVTETDSRPAYVTVLPSTGVSGPLVDDFQSTTAIPNNDWLAIDGLNDGTWEWTNTAGAWSSGSARLVNGPGNTGGVDELLSNTIDASAATTLEVSFRYAFARRNSTNDDILRLYVSKDCGKTWFLRKQLRGSTSLPTAGNTNSTYIPDPNDWGLTVSDNFTQDFYVPGFRVKFEFTSDGGNYLYLDDINITGFPVGIDELNGASNLGVSVYPNPVTDQSNIEVQLDQAATIDVVVLNALGQVVQSLPSFSGSRGSNMLPFATEQLNSGVYMIRTSNGSLQRTVRFVKN